MMHNTRRAGRDVDMAIFASDINRVVMVLMLSTEAMMAGGLQLVHDHVCHALLLIDQQWWHSVGLIDSGVAQLFKHTQEQRSNRPITAALFDSFC